MTCRFKAVKKGNKSLKYGCPLFPLFEKTSIFQIPVPLCLDITCFFWSPGSWIIIQFYFSHFQVKACPRCQVLAVKMHDGSCNHMTCAVCGVEFCWLCMKEISDLHYLSPSGCTFWGKKPWSRKKKLLWQLGTLIGAPVGIALLAGISIPAMLIGIPSWVGRKIHDHFKGKLNEQD